MGWCELRLDDARSARKSFEKALELAPARFDLAIAGLAIAWAKLEKPERATPLLEELHAEHAGSQMAKIAEEQVASALASASPP